MPFPSATCLDAFLRLRVKARLPPAASAREGGGKAGSSAEGGREAHALVWPDVGGETLVYKGGGGAEEPWENLGGRGCGGRGTGRRETENTGYKHPAVFALLVVVWT